MKNVAIFGATGSVGKSAVDVCRENNVKIFAIGIGGNRLKEAEDLIREFSPEYCYVASEKSASIISATVSDTACKIVSGNSGILEIINTNPANLTVVNAVSGAAGLTVSVEAAKSGAYLALANKESMVIAGEIIKKYAKESGTVILPVDSEHSAIFDCLQNGRRDEVNKIILTASGGPFFGKTREEIANTTKETALNHPTWNMGPKITIDSATLCNKGFEVIEAVRLFDIPPEKIEVVIHRESIIHSLVEFNDKSTLALLSNPDMRLPCARAINYPYRIKTSLLKSLDLSQIGKLTFYKPDTEAFPLLPLAFYAINKGGIVPAVYNASNEVAVAAFLNDKIKFGEISSLVEEVTRGVDNSLSADTIDDLMEADLSARDKTEELVKG